jgi:archaellum component FlaC
MAEIEFNEKHIQAIAELKTDMDNIKDKVSTLDSFKDTFKDVVTEIKTLVSVQHELLQKQDQRSESHDKILSEISNNMKYITEEQKNLKADIKELKTERSFNVVSFITTKVVPALLTTGISIGAIITILKALGKI